MADMILTSKEIHRRPDEAACDAYISSVLAKANLTPFDAGTIRAYVNHGRWVADCLCKSGIAVTPNRLRATCLECGRDYAVMFPAEGDRLAIEGSLLERPRPENRNWLPSEKPADLEAENRIYLEAEKDGLLARLAEVEAVLAKPVIEEVK